MNLLIAGLALADPSDAEPFVVAAAHFGESNTDARGAAEALNGVRADVVVITGCSRASLAEETLAVGGYRLLADGRDPTPTGICLVGRVDADAAIVPAPWSSACSGPLAVGRFSAGEGSLVVIGAHLPSRLPACGEGGKLAVRALAALVEGGRLRAPFGPGKPGDAVVVAGNLNTGGRQLAPLVASGLGSGGGGRPAPTWFLGPFGLTLDHVLVPASWQLESTSVFELPGSSHRGVVAGFFAQ